MLTTERKVIALAAAMVLIPVVAFFGVWLRWPDGAPSFVSAPFVVGTVGVGIAGFRLQRRLWPSADRLFDRTSMWMLSVLILVCFVWLLVLNISGGDWVGVVVYSGLLGFWVVSCVARDPAATIRKEDPSSGEHPPPRRAQTLRPHQWVPLVIIIVFSAVIVVQSISGGEWAGAVLQSGLLGVFIWFLAPGGNHQRLG